MTPTEIKYSTGIKLVDFYGVFCTSESSGAAFLGSFCAKLLWYDVRVAEISAAILLKFTTALPSLRIWPTDLCHTHTQQELVWACVILNGRRRFLRAQEGTLVFGRRLKFPCQEDLFIPDWRLQQWLTWIQLLNLHSWKSFLAAFLSVAVSSRASKKQNKWALIALLLRP